jgi:hypothetical protein
VGVKLEVDDTVAPGESYQVSASDESAGTQALGFVRKARRRQRFRTLRRTVPLIEILSSETRTVTPATS